MARSEAALEGASVERFRIMWVEIEVAFVGQWKQDNVVKDIGRCRFYLAI